ncbi:hypothetical protein D3C86_1120110 [compost metagenome]
MPLGDELRADDNIRLALDDGLQLQTQPLDAHEIGREHDCASLGEMFLHLLSNALHAGTAGHQMIEGAAFRAMIGRRLAMAALVALQLIAEAVLHQPAGTLRALETVAADAAERQRRITTAIEEQQRLLALFDRLADTTQQDG